MPTPTIRWNVDADGDWGTAADWDLHRVPNSADDVVINTTDFHTVTHSAGADTVHTLTVRNDDFVFSGGSLTITSASSFANLLAVSGAGTLELDGDTTVARLSQSGALFANPTISGAGTLTVAGSTNFSGFVLQGGPGRTVLQGVSTLLAGGEVALSGGRVLENQGTFILAGSAIVLGYPAGGGALVNDAGATIDIQGDTQIASSSGRTFTNAGLFEKTGGAGIAYITARFANTGAVLVQSGTLEFDGGGSVGAGAFSVASGATLSFGGIFSMASFSLGAGTVGGAGTVALTNGELIIDGDTTVPGFSQDGGFGASDVLSGVGTLTVNGPASFGRGCAHTGAGTTVLEGPSTVSGAIALDGGRILENQGDLTLARFGEIRLGYSPKGDALGGGSLINDAGATIDFQGINDVFDGRGATRFVNAGTIKTTGTDLTFIEVDFIDTGAVELDSGGLEFYGANASIAGLVSGAGTLAFAGGTQSLETGAALTMANWSISGAAATSINETLNYAGAFSKGVGTTLTVAAGDTLSLTGASTLSGTVNGVGVIRLSSAMLSVSFRKQERAVFTLGGSATLSDVGRVDQVRDITIGDAGAAGAILSIEAGAVYSLENRADIARGSSRASMIRNSGLLIKSGGSGVSRIAVKTVDVGAIEAAGGTLRFARAITGGGTLAVDSGATLEVGRAVRKLHMNFDGDGAVHALSKPSAFAATIRHFAAGDTIDLRKTAADAAALGAGDTLVITNGATTVATLQLAGDYSAATFNVASDGKGGTDVTVTGAPAAAPFVAAMAGFGAGGHAPAPAWAPPRADAWRPMLSTPRPTHFA